MLSEEQIDVIMCDNNPLHSYVKFARAIEAAVLEAQEKHEPVAWPVMGYGQVAIGGGKQPNGMSALLYLEMGEAREIDADTTDLFPVGSEAAPDKLMACVYFKDGAAMQQTIDILREMQQEIGYAAPAVQPDMVMVRLDDLKLIEGLSWYEPFEQCAMDCEEAHQRIRDAIATAPTTTHDPNTCTLPECSWCYVS